MPKDSDKERLKTASIPEPADQREGFLRRWSRRKRAEGVRETEEPDTGKSEERQSAQDGETHRKEEKTDADMPSLESLNEKSDYSGFLSPGVSEQLQRTALRKLFRMPMFNIRDGLDDYDEDFRTVVALAKDVVTADMRHQVERAKEKAAKQLEEKQPTGPETTPEDTDVAVRKQPSGEQGAEPPDDIEDDGDTPSDREET
ncbi:MAG: DUF3306 domain-containing protein [Acidiferrobacterales bacterium]